MVTQDCEYCDGREGGCRMCHGTGETPISATEIMEIRRNSRQEFAKNSKGCVVLYVEHESCVVQMPIKGTTQATLLSNDIIVGDHGRLEARGDRLFFLPHHCGL